MTLPLVELARFWAWPLGAILGASVLGVVLVMSAGPARNLGVSMLAGVVAAVVVVPTQVVLARRAAQVEFERDGQLVQLAVDRVLEEVEAMLDRRADDEPGDDPDEPGDDPVQDPVENPVEDSDASLAGPGPDVGAGP